MSMLTTSQIDRIRAILATKAGNVSKSKDYTVSSLHILLSGHELKPLRFGQPFSPLYRDAIEVVLTLGCELVERGSLEAWLKMTSTDYGVSIAEQDFTVEALLDACGIGYESQWVRDQMPFEAIN